MSFIQSVIWRTMIGASFFWFQDKKWINYVILNINSSCFLQCGPWLFWSISSDFKYDRACRIVLETHEANIGTYSWSNLRWKRSNIDLAKRTLHKTRNLVKSTIFFSFCFRMFLHIVRCWALHHIRLSIFRDLYYIVFRLAHGSF